MQLAFFLLSLVSSTRLVYLINRANWLINMKQVRTLQRHVTAFLNPIYLGTPFGYTGSILHCAVRSSICVPEPRNHRCLGLVCGHETSVLIDIATLLNENSLNIIHRRLKCDIECKNVCSNKSRNQWEVHSPLLKWSKQSPRAIGKHSGVSLISAREYAITRSVDLDPDGTLYEQ